MTPIKKELIDYLNDCESNAFKFGAFLSKRQTQHELNSNTTIEKNSVGFNKFDSHYSETFLAIDDGVIFRNTYSFYKKVVPVLSKYHRQFTAFKSTDLYAKK